MLGEVRIDSLLARGGTAEVYLGTHTSLQRRVAVKILHTQYLDDPRFLERFQREARAVAMLRHPNIIQVHDFSVMEGQPYLVMEYLPGGSLSTYINVLNGAGQKLGLADIDRLLQVLADALQYAHNSGVIHRDIKPGNILMNTPAGAVESAVMQPDIMEPVLTDFGLVRMLNSLQTATLQVVGTPAYMSPEQSRGEFTDERTDIYSRDRRLRDAGRNLPFEAETTVALLLKHVNDPPPPFPLSCPANVIDHAWETIRPVRSDPAGILRQFHRAIGRVQRSPLSAERHSSQRKAPAWPGGGRRDLQL
jgi:serine/threonine-protein kinase